MKKVRISVTQTVRYLAEVDINDDHLEELRGMSQQELDDEIGNFLFMRRRFINDVQSEDAELTVLDK